MGFFFAFFLHFLLCLHNYCDIIQTKKLHLGGIGLFTVLVANSNAEYNLKCCNLFSNNNQFEIYKTYTGTNTLDQYHYIKPDIFILDFDFCDINGMEILKKLSISIEEKNNCNTILTTDKCYSDLITDVSKIYKILYKPYKIETIFDIACQMSKESSKFILNLDDIYPYLADFKVHLSTNGCDYLKTAIELCLMNYPFYGNSLEDLLEKIAEKYNKTPEQIRDGLKSALKPINISNQDYARKLYPHIFNDDDLLSPRKFIERSTIYFYERHKKRNKFN